MFIKSLIPFLLSAAVLSPINAPDKVLNENQLRDIFPDTNLRTVVKRYIPADEMTINKIKSLDGEFYASGEHIKDLKGISLLENIDEFVFWNNAIKKLPEEMKDLKDCDSINLGSNYLTDDKVLSELERRGIKVDSDLNFIGNRDDQYKLKIKLNKIGLLVGSKVDLRSVINKNISDYEKYWEVTDKLSKDLKLDIVSEDKSIADLDGMVLIGKKAGTTKLKIAIDSRNNSELQNVVVEVVVK
ncbi:MAG: hypothetical protein LBN09_03260 [Clostridioides sp.]|jgi:hypothetical protein|nr:hypothetical protein [Clostridioides sp.]